MTLLLLLLLLLRLLLLLLLPLLLLHPLLIPHLHPLQQQLLPPAPGCHSVMRCHCQVRLHPPHSHHCSWTALLNLLLLLHLLQHRLACHLPGLLQALLLHPPARGRGGGGEEGREGRGGTGITLEHGQCKLHSNKAAEVGKRSLNHRGLRTEYLQ